MTISYSSTALRSRKYASLDIHKAVNFGWDEHHSLTARELRVLSFVATRGNRNEPGMAFAWFPTGGQDWWAAIMMMPAGSLRRVLHDLRKKGLIVSLGTATKDSRFIKRRGVGIPPEVIDECRQWYADREQMVYSVIPDSLEECSPSEHSCSPHEQPCSPSEYRTPHSPTPTRDSGSYTHHIDTREGTHILTDASSPSGFSQSDPPGGHQVRASGDGWDQPKDPVDTFDVPREVREKPAPYHRPSTRVLDAFHDAWLVSRQKRTNLPLDCSVKMIFLRNINLMLQTFSEDDLHGMVREFWLQVDTGRIIPAKDECWRDFLYHKGKLFKLMRQRSPVAADLAAMAAESNRRQEALR